MTAEAHPEYGEIIYFYHCRRCVASGVSDSYAPRICAGYKNHHQPTAMECLARYEHLLAEREQTQYNDFLKRRDKSNRLTADVKIATAAGIAVLLLLNTYYLWGKATDPSCCHGFMGGRYDWWDPGYIMLDNIFGLGPVSLIFAVIIFGLRRSYFLASER